MEPAITAGMSLVDLPVGLRIVGHPYDDDFVPAAAQAQEMHAGHLATFRERSAAWRR